MGYGFPASIGIQVAHTKSLVINVAGEASWLMNMQELGTAVQYRLPVKQFILNNERLGMVRQWQEKFHDNRLSWVSTRSPNFQKIGEWYNIKSHTISSFSDMDENLETILSEKWPALIWFKIKTEDNVFPMVPPGKTLWEVITE